MIPDAHIFEGTADNYPFVNELSKEDLKGNLHAFKNMRHPDA